MKKSLSGSEGVCSPGSASVIASIGFVCFLNGGENYCCRGASFASVQSYLYHADTTKGIVDLEINRGGEELKVCREVSNTQWQQTTEAERSGRVCHHRRVTGGEW